GVPPRAAQSRRAGAGARDARAHPATRGARRGRPLRAGPLRRVRSARAPRLHPDRLDPRRLAVRGEPLPKGGDRLSPAKLLALLFALVLIPTALVYLSPRATHTGPEAIRYDRDTCAHCRMHFAAPGFAAERRDAGGALLKYDDIGCMLTAASRGAS